MKEPDRETIYTAALLTCGLPPKPDNFRSQTGHLHKSYTQVHNDWLHLAEHIVYTALRPWIHYWYYNDQWSRQKTWKHEKQQFLNWISVQQTKQKVEEYEAANDQKAEAQVTQGTSRT